MDQFSEFVLILQIIAIFSFTATSIALINSIFLFLFQRKNDEANSAFSISMAVIFIFLGDSLANGAYLSQYRPKTGSVDCSITGFIHILGYMITWMFTLYMAYVMYSATVWEKMPVNVIRDFSLCFGIPLVLMLIQAFFFGFSNYTSATYDVCFTALHNQNQLIYHWVSFWGLLLSVCLAMLVMRGHQFLLEIKQDQRTQSRLFSASKFMLQYYPFVLIACWIPTIIETNTGPQTPQLFHLVATALKISHGLWVGSIYFICGDLARKHFWDALNPISWINLLRGDQEHDSMFRESYLQERESNMEMTKSIYKDEKIVTNPIQS